MMDEALSKSGEWPNVAIMSGTDPQEAKVRYGVDAAESHGEAASATQTAEPEQVPAGAGNGTQDGSECADTREKLEADAVFNRVVGHCMARGDSLGEAMLHADGYLQSKQESEAPEQAIAATLGRGECVPHGEWESISQSQEVRRVFCDCGYELGMDERDSRPFNSTRLFAMPNYCQECGRKIRKAVKR